MGGQLGLLDIESAPHVFVYPKFYVFKYLVKVNVTYWDYIKLFLNFEWTTIISNELQPTLFSRLFLGFEI
jgi:hypothetical protein